jgi:hypothetical protein
LETEFGSGLKIADKNSRHALCEDCLGHEANFWFVEKAKNPLRNNDGQPHVINKCYPIKHFLGDSFGFNTTDDQVIVEITQIWF